MPVDHASRKAAEQVYSIYARGLHPELFTIYDERTIHREGYSAEVWIIGLSHVVTFRAGRRTLTEVVADARQDLPVQHRLHSFRFGVNPERTFRYDHGIAVDARFDVRACAREEFLARVRDIRRAMLPDGVLRVFSPPGESGPGAGGSQDGDGLPALTAVGFVPQERSLLVRAYHTFPEDLTIIETHSRWEVRQVD